MSELKVVRLEETEIVKFGPDAVYQLIIGDDDGSTPVRTGIQTSQPGYETPLHSHPYLEILHVLEGRMEAWLEGDEDRKACLGPGDTVALPPNVPHGFRVVGQEVLRTYGVHASPRRVTTYVDGRATDARAYPAGDARPPQRG
jgi:quercetin dioxygenase-like cupin family protein